MGEVASRRCQCFATYVVLLFVSFGGAVAALAQHSEPQQQVQLDGRHGLGEFTDSGTLRAKASPRLLSEHRNSEEAPEWAGKYADPNHPGCPREIAVRGGGLVISGEDGNPGCEGGGTRRPWQVPASFRGSDQIVVDFSSKGGPKDLVATWEDGGIRFSDGNRWTKVEDAPTGFARSSGAARAVLLATQSAAASMTQSAPGSVGVVLVFVFTAGLWLLELNLTKRFDEKMQDERLEQQQNLDATTSGCLPSPLPFFPALGCARYLISWHVVVYNFFHFEAHKSTWGAPIVNFARWGELAAPTFFLVSGFCHTYSKLVGRGADVAEDWVYGMARRVAPWYPLFLCALVCCALQNFSKTAEDWADIMANAFLVHGLIWNGPRYPYMHGDWWLSFLMLYLILFSPMYEAIKGANNSVLWTLFTISVLVALPIAIFEWMWGSEMPLWAAASYWPSFVFGQALAAWFFKNCMRAGDQGSPVPSYSVKPTHEIPLMPRFGVTISMLVLGTCFFTFAPCDKIVLLRAPVAPLVLRGGALPILGLMTLGLACEVDPVAKLFARAPFSWLGQLSLGNFFLQVPVHNAVQRWTGWEGLSWTFVVSLFLISVAVHVLFERPWRSWLKAKKR